MKNETHCEQTRSLATSDILPMGEGIQYVNSGSIAMQFIHLELTIAPKTLRNSVPKVARPPTFIV